MEGGGGGTSGGAAGRAWLAWLGIATAFAVVNAVSTLDDFARVGQPIATWKAWTWELTSLVSWAILVPLVFAASARARPPRYPLLAAIVGHAIFALILSAFHVLIMVVLRKLIYLKQGLSYELPDGIWGMYVYEARKDLVTYAGAALIFLLIERLLRPAPAPAPASEPAEPWPLRLEVRDGARTVWLAPEDVEWAQSAGNYVELHGGFGTLLHRETLAALETQLEPFGFRRIHRSRIVRAPVVRAVETRSSGDFDVTLASGERLIGSRRFRSRLEL